MYRTPSGLSWHDDTIASNEVWVKLGGNKGHGSFKMNLQVVNVTHLLAVYKAGDSTTNLPWTSIGITLGSFRA